MPAKGAAGLCRKAGRAAGEAVLAGVVEQQDALELVDGATILLRVAHYSESEVLTFNALLTLLGRRLRQSIYDLMRRDPTFPKPRQIGSEFSVGWLRGEVMEWLNVRPPVQFNGLDALERRRRAQGAKRSAEVT